MQDGFQKHFGWIGAMTRPPSDFFDTASQEHEILTAFKAGWGQRDTLELLQELDARYGEAAGRAVEEYIRRNILLDWPKVGMAHAHPGTEIEDFVRVLWGPLESQGFEFEAERKDGTVAFRVTRCPLHELAQRTGMHRWLYHLACSTDFHTPSAFSPKVGFDRSKTLMQGHDCCDHRYFPSHE